MLVAVNAGVEVEESRCFCNTHALARKVRMPSQFHSISVKWLPQSTGFQDIHAQLNLIAQHHKLDGHQTKESMMMLIALKCIYNLMEGPLRGVTAQPRSQSSNL